MTAPMRGPLESDPTVPHDRPIVRLAVSVVLIGAAVTVIVAKRNVRQAESVVLGWLASDVFGLASVSNPLRPVVYVTMPAPDDFVSPYWIGLTVTPECSSAWLVAPLVGLAGVLAFGRRLALRAVVVATGITAGVLVVVNLVRLSLILLATHWWGESGYQWSHNVYGSLVAIVGVCGGLALFMVLVVRLSRRQLQPGPG